MICIVVLNFHRGFVVNFYYIYYILLVLSCLHEDDSNLCMYSEVSNNQTVWNKRTGQDFKKKINKPTGMS